MREKHLRVEIARIRARSRGILGPLAVLALGLLLARPAGSAPAAPSGIAGAGVSGLQVVNLDPVQSAEIVVDFFNQHGGQPVTIRRVGVPPGSSANVYLPAEATLTNGAYAARVTSDRPIASLARTDWTASGGATLYEQSRASTEVVLPWLVKDYVGQSSIFSIQNSVLDRAIPVEVELLGAGSAMPAASFELSLPAGGSRTVDLARDEVAASLPSGFLGWARLRAAEPISALALVDNATSELAVGDVAAMPAESASERLVAPMLFHDWGAQERGSSVAVLNPSAEVVEVRLQYDGLAGSCAGMEVVHGPVELAPGAIQVFGQSDLDLPGAGPSGLPAGCAASGIIESDGAVLATVSVQGLRDNSLGSYPALSSSEAAETLHFPLVRREHTSSLRLTSELQLSNPSDEAAEVELTLLGSDGLPIDCGADCRRSVPAGGGVRWDFGQIEAMPANSYGLARLTSSEPVVAAVLDGSATGAVDDAIYMGLSADPLQPMRSLVPLLLRAEVRQPGPGASPTPAATRTPVATQPTPLPGGWTLFALGFVDVVGGEDGQCPGCDGEYDPEDEQFALQNPLGTLRFVVRDESGAEVGSGQSSALQSLQRAMIQVPALEPGEHYQIELLAPPDGWDLCPAESLVRRVEAEDFQQRSARLDYHFWTGCPPRIAPPPTALPTAAPTAGVPEGSSLRQPGVSGIMITNRFEEQTVDLEVDHLALGASELAGTIQRPGVVPGQTSHIYLPSENRLPDGGFGARLRPELDRLTAVARTDWVDTGAATLYSAPPAAERLLLPQLDRGKGGRYSVIALQNGDAETEAQLHIELFDGAGGLEPVASYGLSLPPAGSELLRLDLDERLPEDFAGWGRVEADRPVSVMVFAGQATSPGISSLPGLAPDDLSQELVVPAIFHLLALDPDQTVVPLVLSQLELLNPGDTPVKFSLSYTGNDDPEARVACADYADHLDGLVALPGTRLRIDTGSMPTGCAGSARIRAEGGPLAATLRVVDPERGLETSIAARPVESFVSPPTGEDWRYEIPIFRRSMFTSRMSTPIELLNPGEATVAARIELTDAKGQAIACGEGCEIEIAAGESRLWRPDSVEAIPVGSYGSARLYTDGPLDVLVIDLSLEGESDLASLRVREAAAPQVAGLPLLLKRRGLLELGSNPRWLQPPALRLPATLPAVEDDQLVIPLELRSRGHAVRGIHVHLDLDERWLRLDSTELGFSGGLPTGVRSHLPEDVTLWVEFDPEAPRREVMLVIEAATEDPSATIPDGLLVELLPDVIAPSPSEDAGWIGFSSHLPIDLWGLDAEPLEVDLQGGWRPMPSGLYLPLLLRGGGS